MQASSGERTTGLAVDPQACEPAVAIVLAEQLLGLAEGRDRPTETHLRLQLARGGIARGRWPEARGHLAKVATRESGRTMAAEVAILQAECALGEDRPGQRAVVEHLAARGVALATAASDPEMEAEALAQAGRVARMRDLGAAAASLRSALDVTERHQLSYRRLQILNESAPFEMLRDAHPGRPVRARHEAMRCGASGLAASAGLNLASAYAMTGRVNDCLKVAREVASLAERLGHTPLLAGCEFIEGVGHAFLGDQVRARTPSCSCRTASSR